MAANPSYINPASGASGSLVLTVANQIITTGAAGGSVLVRAALMSPNAANRTVTISDGSGNVMQRVTLNANAGNTANVLALDLLNANIIPGEENDAYGNKVFRLRPSETLQISVDSVSGGAPILYWSRADF